MRSSRIDDFLDFIMMLFFSGLIYGLGRCFEVFPAYESLSIMNIAISDFMVEIICIFFMVLMVVVFFREYTILSLLMVGLSPYIFYQFILLLYEIEVFRYIFVFLTLFYILFYIILVIRYGEDFNMSRMLNRYCMIMFCIMYIVTVVSMSVSVNRNVETVNKFSLNDYQDTFIKFKEDNWKRLSITDKQKALKEFVVIDLMYLLGEEDNDIEVSIKSLASQSTGGYYSFKNEEIVVNENVLLDRNKIITVLLHESFHRYQHKVIEAFDDKMDLNLKLVRDVREWKDNVYNYVSANDNYNDYYNQSLEKDAREYADQYLSMYVKFIDGLKEN